MIIQIDLLASSKYVTYIYFCRSLILPAMKHPWILCIFITVVALDFALMTANTGIYYEAIYTPSSKEAQDYQILQHHQMYLHQCSIKTNCNYVVEDKKNGVRMYNTRSELPANEETIGIWKKVPSEFFDSVVFCIF